MPLQLVIFDCDGVLVDSVGLSNRVLSAFITETGWTITQSQCRDMFVGRRMAM